MLVETRAPGGDETAADFHHPAPSLGDALAAHDRFLDLALALGFVFILGLGLALALALGLALGLAAGLAGSGTGHGQGAAPGVGATPILGAPRFWDPRLKRSRNDMTNSIGNGFKQLPVQSVLIFSPARSVS